jgi:hypothetical protein
MAFGLENWKMKGCEEGFKGDRDRSKEVELVLV